MRRKLSATEQDEAKLVFNTNIHYDRVSIVEASKIPLWIARIGSAIAGKRAPNKNAVTLRTRIYFSERIETRLMDIQETNIADMAWLVHELTHIWQYQHIGMRYLLDAIRVQLKQGSAVYDYGHEEGLQHAHQTGKNLLDFNPEQQGEIARDFYLRLKGGEDFSTWLPFIDELKTLPFLAD